MKALFLFALNKRSLKKPYTSNVEGRPSPVYVTDRGSVFDESFIRM